MGRKENVRREQIIARLIVFGFVLMVVVLTYIRG